MEGETNSKRLVLLMDPDYPTSGSVSQWLAKSGLVTWKANDLCHALEELSDFTVRMTPDVILLEVASITECFDTLSSTLSDTNGRAVSVIGFSGDTALKRRNSCFANDLEQLGTIISRERKALAA